tara:strand:+ start:539 stop:772 length:234 start_codon:yes stop_codon:yes gene_type:complete
MGKIKETTIDMVEELKETLKKQLESHDWFYHYSDDHRYWSSGHRQALEIDETLKKMRNLGQYEIGFAMYKQYKHKLK